MKFSRETLECEGGWREGCEGGLREGCEGGRREGCEGGLLVVF